MPITPEKLPENPTVLKEMVVDLSGKNNQLSSRISALEAQLRLLQKHRFQSRSERFPEHPDLFSEAFNEIECLNDKPDTEEVLEIPAHKRTKKRKDRALSPDLPRVDVVHDLPEHDKKCDCGETLEFIGREQGVEQLAIIPPQHYVIRHFKNKYACSCKQCIKRAAMPAQPIPKSQASPILLAYLMVAKLLDGLPLYRLEKIIARDGLVVSRQNMARWLIQASDWFDRLLEAFEQQINHYDIAAADETRLQVLKEPNRLPTSKSWLWIRRGGPPDQPVVLVDYNPSRSGDVPLALMNGFHNGYLCVDAYAGYNRLVKDNKLKVVACHDHARRKFVEAYDSLSSKQRQTQGGIAKQAIERYKALYNIEADLKGKSPEEKKEVRQRESLPLLIDFKDWLDKVKSQVVLSEKTSIAVNYFINQFESLKAYCEDGRLPISNIQTEHVAKLIAVARKNFLFANTPSGATSSAKIYSMIVTAIANGLEPTRYLSYILTELPQIKKDQSIEQLLPWNLSPEALSEKYDKIPRP